MMRKVSAIVVAGLMLGGCAQLRDFQSIFSAAEGYSITQGMLDSAQNTYDGTALATLKSYAKLPACAPSTSFTFTNRCHDKAILKKLRNADAAVAQAFVSTQDQVTSGNSSGAAAAYKTLQTAITAAKKVISDNNLLGL